MAASIIKLKRSSVPGKKPTVNDLPLGELGRNVYITNDQRAEIKKKINIEIEPGRIYLMDTSIVHDGKWESNNSEDVYQFFLSVVPECYDLIKQNIMMMK
jgi:hypothetical protein